MSELSQDESEIATRAIERAETMYRRGEWNGAFAFLKERIDEAQSCLTKARFQLALAEAYNWELVSGLNHDAETHALLDEVEAAAGRSVDELLMAAALHQRGVRLHVEFITDKGDPDHELECFSRAAALRRKHGDTAGEANSLSWIGIFHHVDRLDRATAEPILREAYELAKRSGSRSARAEAARHIGQIIQELGDPLAALPFLEESYELMDSDAPVVAAAAMHALASAYLDAGDLDRAEESVGRASALVGRFNLPLIRALVKRTEADIEFARLAPYVWNRRHP